MIFLFGLVSVVGFIAGMTAPENDSANQFIMGQIYTLDFPDFESSLEITSTDPAIFDTSITLCGNVYYKTANRWFLFFFWTFYLACLFLSFMIVLHLLRFLESLKDGSPFVAENISRIKYIGWSVIAFTLLRIIMLGSAVFYMNNDVHVANGSLALPFGEVMESLHLEIAFVGFVILIIAQIFQEGLRMKTENELTV